MWNENGNGKVKRHPLSFLVEAADSISYNIMDVEDGFTMGWYSFDDVIDFINKFMQKESGDEKYSILDKLHLAKSFEEKESMQMMGVEKCVIFVLPLLAIL